jgi:hypothetical protein
MDATALRTDGPTVKRDRLVYGISTGIIALLMASSALNFAFNESQKAAFQHLGLPGWFRIELTIAKLAGVVALVLPASPPLARQFAYFGFGLTIVSADVAHLSSGDPVWFIPAHAFFLATLVVSYRSFHRLHGAARAGAER